ncbi:hypothetical protein OG21DRAFT_1412094 [Imleria badia]|nr:hypothetical protein OG21DRAFT_1412094 [Imleria badia]
MLTSVNSTPLPGLKCARMINAMRSTKTALETAKFGMDAAKTSSVTEIRPGT